MTCMSGHCTTKPADLADTYALLYCVQKVDHLYLQAANFINVRDLCGHVSDIFAAETRIVSDCL